MSFILLYVSLSLSSSPPSLLHLLLLSLPPSLLLSSLPTSSSSPLPPLPFLPLSLLPSLSIPLPSHFFSLLFFLLFTSKEKPQ